MSLLNCLCAAIPARERVITCEEVFELSKSLPLGGRLVLGAPAPVAVLSAGEEPTHRDAS
jgi:hypothetical protein